MFACWSLSASLAQPRAEHHQVAGLERSTIRSADHLKARWSSGERAYHLASSFQRLSRRFSAVIDVATTLACGRVAMNHQIATARTRLLPGPLQAFMATRLCLAILRSARFCQASSSRWKTSSAKRTGSSHQRASCSATSSWSGDSRPAWLSTSWRSSTVSLSWAARSASSPWSMAKMEAGGAGFGRVRRRRSPTAGGFTCPP